MDAGLGLILNPDVGNVPWSSSPIIAPSGSDNTTLPSILAGTGGGNDNASDLSMGITSGEPCSVDSGPCPVEVSREGITAGGTNAGGIAAGDNATVVGS